MKLKVKFILITIITVLIISISSISVFYFIANGMLMQQQSKSLVNATTNFAFAFQTELQKTDEDFQTLITSKQGVSEINLDSTRIDFLFTLVNDTLINAKDFKARSNSYLNIRTTSFQKFFIENPTLVLRYAQVQDGKTYYYGRLISSDMLNLIGEKINADIALVVNEAPVEVSNPEQNQSRLLSIVNASRYLKYKNNFDLYTENLSEADFLSSLYNPKYTLFPASKVHFIIFQAFKEIVDFRNTLFIVMMLIIIAGSAITIIIVLVTTMKMGKQITLLSKVAEEARKGNFEHRVPVITKDEIGHFGETFNEMLDELLRNRTAEKEYSEFIALINQNPTLKEIADSALSKIVRDTHLAFGALYLVDRKTMRLISAAGIGKSISNPDQATEFYNDAITKNEISEFIFTENHPEIKAGIASIKIKYLVIYPIIYNKETIAILELASESEPKSNIKDYINSIQEQLAIGLVNAKSFEQLENLVGELQILNEEYQKQNNQIVEQNAELKKLHSQLREKADELSKQRERAVELTKVKSEFLASMSHELRTPLISILGLTELMLKDLGIASKVKERLNIVDRNGKKLLALITNILEFSKFEAGKIDLKKETFLLGEFIEEIYPSIHQLTTEKELLLVIDLPKNKNILINTDKTKLEQILLNLVVNAIKFTEKGFVKIKAVVNNLSELILSVEDSGIGISESNQKIIFNEFKQVDSSTSRKYGGAGLGLAICNKYANILGGKISLESEPGKGSEFSITLPEVVLDIIDVSGHEFLTIKEEEPYTKQDSQETVLLINNNSSACKLISDYLTSYHLKVEVVEKAISAKSLINEHHYKAVILNPLDNAWYIASLVTNSEINKNTPLIFTLILDEQKVGWQPDIFGFIFGKIDEEIIFSRVDDAEKFYNVRTEHVIVVSNSNEQIREIENLFLARNDKIFIKSVSSIQELISLPTKASIDHIFVDVTSLQENSLEICYAASLDRGIRNKPITVLLPQEVSSSLDEKMQKKFKEIAMKIKLHPLDILKFLRDRLQIGEKTVNKKIQLIVEPVEEVIPVKDDKKQYNTRPTILIVDDDNDALYTVGEYVKELECDTVFAHNGMECLLMLNTVKPDLILLDIMMPQMDGFEAIKRIRNDNRLSKIPVIALTAYAMLDNKNVIEKNGFDDLITKPINSQTLSLKLAKFISIKEKQ